MDITESPILTFEEILKTTNKAYQIKFSTEDICWLPKSQIRIINNYIYMPEWLIKNNGLDKYVIT